MAGKRGAGEGTIRHREDGRWEARVRLANGQRRSFYGVTRQAVQRKLTTALHDLEQGLPLVAERQSFEAYMASWLEMIRPTIKASTLQRYSEQVRIHLIPTLGKTKVARLTPAQVQRLYSEKLEAGLSPTTVNHLHSVLHRALKDALRLGLVPRNIADAVTPPRETRHEMHVLTAEQARQFLAAAQGERLEALFTVALSTGARLGELLALRWSDLDLDAGRVQIRHTLRHTGAGAYILTQPKTKAGRRSIDIAPEVLDVLRRHKARQSEQRLSLGAAWHDGDFIFTREDGMPLRGTHVLQRHFRPLLERAGLPPIRFHDLRHTAATLWLLAGIPPRVVADQLGHSTITVTLDTYSHVLPDMRQAAAKAMRELLFRDARTAEK